MLLPDSRFACSCKKINVNIYRGTSLSGVVSCRCLRLGALKRFNVRLSNHDKTDLTGFEPGLDFSSTLTLTLVENPHDWKDKTRQIISSRIKHVTVLVFRYTECFLLSRSLDWSPSGLCFTLAVFVKSSWVSFWWQNIFLCLKICKCGVELLLYRSWEWPCL